MPGHQGIHVRQGLPAREFHEPRARHGGHRALSQSDPQKTDRIAAILQGYADRGVFRGFSRGPERGGKVTFKLLWHRNRSFDLVVDTNKKTLVFPLLLPELPAASSLYAEFQEFIASRQSKKLPEHRRIDSRKARISSRSRRGNVSLTLTLQGADYDYGVRKLIHLVHEIFLVLLAEGPFYEYQVEAFDLDPDRP